MAKRGVSIGGTVVPVTGASVNPSRSLITEQSFGSAGEARIYDGGVVTTGSVEGAYRAGGIFDTVINDVMNVMSGNSDALATRIVIIGDEYGGVSLGSTAFNSFEISMNVKDYAKVKLGFVSSGVGTSGSVSADGTYTDPIPVASTSQITCSNAGTKFSGISIRGEIPIDQDYYVIGTKQLAGILQSGNGSLTGTLTLAATEWDGLVAAVGSCGNLGTITFTMNSAGPTCESVPVGVIEIQNVKIESGSASGQGRQRFDKTINWRAEVNSTTNASIM